VFYGPRCIGRYDPGGTPLPTQTKAA